MTKKARKLNNKEKKIILDMQKLAKRWPKSLKLFSWSGSLCIIDSKTGQLFEDINIENDGGDPDNEMIDGIVFITRPFDS